MKLLFFISSMRGGGAEHIMSMLCNKLVERGYEIFLVTDTRTAFAYKIDSRINILSLYPENYEKTFRFVRFVRFLNLIRNYVKKIGPDVIVTFMFSLNARVILATRGLGVPIIASARSTYHQKINFIQHIMWYNVHRLASVVTLLTQYDYEYVKTKIPKKVVIPNPLLYPVLNCKVNRDNVIIAVGSLDRYHEKGFDGLIKLWGRIRHLYPGWHLEIAGDGTPENVDYLKKLAYKCSVRDSVHFLGFQNRVDLLFQRCAVFVLTSSVEGFPNVLLEAMSQGCACISFDCITGPSEILTNGVSGLLVQNQNWVEMEKNLSLVLSDTDLRNKLAENALKEVERFLPDRVIGLWEELFRKVISKKREGR